MTTRATISALAAALITAVMLFAAPALAAEPVLGAAAGAAVEGPPEGALGTTATTAMLFWILAGFTVAGAIFVITRRNLVAAVMGLVFTFFAVAALYAMLFAHFLAVLQVLVYAGAIMVLFVFVIMILNKPEDEPWALSGVIGKALAGVALAYFVFRLGGVLWTVKDTAAAAAATLAPGATVDGGDFGSVAEVGRVLFTDYVFAFEALAVILLSAVVGAIAVARPGAGAATGQTAVDTEATPSAEAS